MADERFTYDPIKHEYRHGDKLVVSVTRVLQHSGLIDTSYMGGGEYLERGIVVHDATARHDLGQKVDMRTIKPKWRGFFDAWLRFKQEADFRPRLVEHRVFSYQHWYAGTVDRVGKFGYESESSLETILDLKNQGSGKPGDWVRYQLVAYGNALDPKRMFNRVAVALHGNGSYHVRTWGIEDWLKDLGVFLEAAEHARKGNEFMRMFGSKLRRQT